MFCKDCKHVQMFNGHYLCGRSYRSTTNPVTGETKTSGALKSCEYERNTISTLTCWPQGRFYEEN